MTSSGKFVRQPRSHPEQGYILLTLMFLATLVILSLAALAPQLTQQIKRDQEEEMIHRGVQYSRAIQHFYKKTGRYPTRLEELDDFNNIRFLRKHYKDPITGQDFKLLHFGDVRTMFGAGGAGIPGAAAAMNQPPGSLGTTNPGFSNPAFGNKGLNNQGALNQSADANQQVQPSNQQSTDDSSSDNPMQPVSQLASGSSQDSNANGMGGTNQVFGGGPVVGVASTSNKKSIREFNKKNHYKDWQFIYDPSSDRGGLLNTPAQPNLNASLNNSGQTNSQTGPGQAQGFGPQTQQPTNFGQQPNGFGQQNMPMPNQPPDQTEEQQR
jgi:type II secretory pathway pseudopilin PulG